MATMSLTNTGETLALDAILTTTNKWLALFTVAPGETGGGTEVSGGSYARTAVTWASAVAGAPSTKNPSATVIFPTATADWAAGATLVVAFGIFDASTAGNLIWYGTLTVSRNILNGDTASFAASALTFTMD
jgi:hypothetical protein